MFFWYASFQRSQLYNSLLTHAFTRMFFKTFKKIAARVLSGIKQTIRLLLFFLFVNPIKHPCLFFKHCFKHSPWCDVFISYILRFFHDRNISKVGSYLRVTARNGAKSSTWCSIQSMLAAVYFLFCYFFYTLICRRKGFTFKRETNIINTSKKFDL